MKQLLLLILLCICVRTESAENLRHHLSYCKPATGKACYEKIVNALATTTAHTADWYYLTGFQLDYLYDQQQFKKVETLSLEILNQDAQLPPVLSAQIYFYLSKSLLALYSDQTQRQLAKQYAEQAFALLEQFEQAFPDPMRIIELANLKHVFGDSQHAFDILYRLQRKHQDSNDPMLHAQLNMNLAHSLHNMKRYNEAIEYRKACVDWSLKLNDTHFIVVSLGNLARTHQILGELEKADKAYQLSLPYFEKLEESRMISGYYLRLTQINQGLKKHTVAKSFYDKIHFADLLHYHHEEYNELGKMYQN